MESVIAKLRRKSVYIPRYEDQKVRVYYNQEPIWKSRNPTQWNSDKKAKPESPARMLGGLLNVDIISQLTHSGRMYL